VGCGCLDVGLCVGGAVCGCVGTGTPIRGSSLGEMYVL